MTTSFAPTSRCAILPSGETRDLVMPGMFKVVAGGLTLGVAVPEFCRIGGLIIVSKLANNSCLETVLGSSKVGDSHQAKDTT